VTLALLLGLLMFCPNNVAITGNKAFAKLMILTHYDIDHGDVAVQYMLKNAVVGNSGASTDNAVCVSQWQSKISCV
jgi:hypothetical protein